jgi:hypothetical protein
MKEIPIDSSGSIVKEEMRYKLAREYRSNPIVQRYHARCAAAGDRFRLTRPADALGERETVYLSLMLNPTAYRPLYRLPDEAPDDLSEEAKHAALCLRFAFEVKEAEIFLWRHEPREGALGASLPDHIFGPEGWPYPTMWWTLETNLVQSGQTMELTSILLTQMPGGVQETLFLAEGEDTRSQTLAITCRYHPYGSEVSENSDVPGNRDWCSVLKMLAFLNSDYIAKDPVRMDRCERRELIRAGLEEEAEQTVRVVTLRQPKKSPAEGEDGESGRDWAARWWVRGHIRKQWCPSTKSHKVIWIAPYLKGPEDKPIAHRVYAVVR